MCISFGLVCDHLRGSRLQTSVLDHDIEAYSDTSISKNQACNLTHIIPHKVNVPPAAHLLCICLHQHQGMHLGLTDIFTA